MSAFPALALRAYHSSMDAVDRAQDAEERIRQSRLDEILPAARVAGTCRPGSRECAECGRPIPMKRLRALPSAQLCIGCQREAEKGRPF